MRNSVLGLTAIGIVHLLVSSSAIAAEAGPTCEASKLGTVAKYDSCRLKADAKAIKAGGSLPGDYTKCSLEKFESAEDKGGVACPTTDDKVAIKGFVDACTASVSDALSGNPLLLDVVTCNEDLTDCDADLSTTNADLTACSADLSSTNADLQDCASRPTAAPLKTQQSACYTGGGASTPCSGTGQDGELQNGVGRSFADNGDGTVTDNSTGLMWEKLSDDGSDHDKNDTYTWANAIAVKIAALNAANFAGHDDWRLPNRFELETLVNLGTANPATFAEFDDNCVASCTVTTCSCTAGPGNTWSSTTDENSTSSAWTVGFDIGDAVQIGKGNLRYVRAVRGTTDSETCSLVELGVSQSNLAACESNLGACESNCDAALRPPLQTGQVTTYGAGSDGDLLHGAGHSFTDNGDGTITDNTTGLMWEKKSDDGSIHDKDGIYTWGMTSAPYTMNGSMVTTFLAALNSGGGFAGHTDWRIPNRNELLSITNMERYFPATFAALNDSCTGGCTVTTCSCTVPAGGYWSTTTYAFYPDEAWGVDFDTGDELVYGKNNGLYVRAVRGGS